MIASNQNFIKRHPLSLMDTYELRYYESLADELSSIWINSGFMPDVPDYIRDEAVFAITGYFEDIASDLGVWRSFIDLNRKFYGKPLPFYEAGEDYIDYELNKEDIKFLIWYVLNVFPSEKNDRPDPYDRAISEMADSIFFRLDEAYEAAPSLHEYFDIRELDLHSEADSEELMQFGSWLYWKSYLMYPALESNMPFILQDIDTSDTELVTRCLSEAQAEFPTGPLALYLREWMYMIFKGKLPPQHIPQSGEPHKYYTAFVKATGGKRTAYFSSYHEMNRFFITALGWEDGIEHLASLKDEKDFTLFVSPEKGMLVARNVARCINDPDNPLFDRSHALSNSYRMLSERGYCPCDLLRYSIRNGWLTEARYPHHEDIAVKPDDADFIARCMLQIYYRD